MHIKNKLIQAIINVKMKKLRKLLSKILKQVKLAIKDLEVKNNKLYIRDQIYVPNNKKLQLYLLQKYYDSFKQGYSDHKAIFQDIQTRYYWPNMVKNCKKYTVNYSICCRTKAYHI